MKYIRWFYRIMRPYRFPMSVMMMCHVLLACCAIAFVYVSKKSVDIAVAISEGNDEASSLIVWVVVMVSVIFLRILLNAMRTFLQTKTEIRIKNGLRRKLFDTLLHLQADGISRHHSGDLLNRMQEDVRVVSSVMAVSVPNLVGTSLQFAAALVFLVVLDVRLAAVILIVVPVGILAGRFISGRIRGLTTDIRKSDSQVQSHLQESIQHLNLLKSLEHADSSSMELQNLQETVYDNELRRARFSILSRFLIALAFQAGHAVAFLWGVLGISTGTVTYGMMTAFLQLVGQIQRPLVEISSYIPALIHSTASVDRIMEIESMPMEEATEQVLAKGMAGVRFEHVSFAYPDSREEVLCDFSHDFRPGSRTAIVGPTGVGKSTLIRLLLSFLEPQSGKIVLYGDQAGDDIPVSASTRCNLVYVPQGNSLFSGTIRENLLMGNPEAGEEELCEALRTAAADFVFSLPYGLETQRFEAGAGLSQGQGQRPSLARALLRPGSILLLDEFSSALDAQTELTLMERLTSRLPNHTMIFITHRERIIDYCDSVLKLS